MIVKASSKFSANHAKNLSKQAEDAVAIIIIGDVVAGSPVVALTKATTTRGRKAPN